MSRLKLTKEEIEQARQAAQATPPLPEVLTIRAVDLPAEEAAGVVVTAPLTITAADLTAVPPQTAATANVRALEQQMFGLVIAARRAHLPGWLGTRKLHWHEGLAAVARGHSADMLQRHYVDHVAPEGTTAMQRIERYGIRYLACGENIGIVYGAAGHAEGIEEIHHTFMNQPPRLTNHRGNLLNPIWTHVGIGVAISDSGALVATQNFISAPGVRQRGR